MSGIPENTCFAVTSLTSQGDRTIVASGRQMSEADAAKAEQLQKTIDANRINPFRLQELQSKTKRTDAENKELADLKAKDAAQGAALQALHVLQEGKPVQRLDIKPPASTNVNDGICLRNGVWQKS